MAANLHSRRQRAWQSLASVRTGIILLILVGAVAAAGTVILQRPATDPDQIQRAYSPGLLRWLDALGLTNVFHSWWFALLLALLSLSIVLASIERFPTAWHYFARPYRRPEPHFR
ncbi:MAG TPA: cytochrome c biogenesis protein ResB, partial [Terriglobales bacterium]|nr:cytochrome c biogenesis protein ResB [Terriglobales bacterium]